MNTKRLAIQSTQAHPKKNCGTTFYFQPAIPPLFSLTHLPHQSKSYSNSPPLTKPNIFTAFVWVRPINNPPKAIHLAQKPSGSAHKAQGFRFCIMVPKGPYYCWWLSCWHALCLQLGVCCVLVWVRCVVVLYIGFKEKGVGFLSYRFLKMLSALKTCTRAFFSV